jgi:hypothetical protein
MDEARKLRIAAAKFIRVGQEFGCTIPDLPQVMTVTFVSETEVHFTRKGVSGIKIMDTLKFAEIAIPRERGRHG